MLPGAFVFIKRGFLFVNSPVLLSSAESSGACCPTNNSVFVDCLGNGSVWHGYADILVKGSVVKLNLEDSDDDDDNADHDVLGDESGEPVQKRMRIGSIGYDGNSTDESFDSIVEVKKDVIDTRAMSQGLAQTIVNAFCEVKKNPSMSNTFIPSFIATGKSIRITMYNCEIDRLIMSEDLKLFSVDKESQPILNVSTILSVWYALNFDIFIDKINPESEIYKEFLTVYKKSNFIKHARHKISVYRENCDKPMTTSAVFKQLDFGVGYMGSYSFISKMVLSNRKVMSILSEKT